MSEQDRYRNGDVFWAPDPFREGSNPRLWLVLASGTLPSVGDEYLCAALTTSDLPATVVVGDDWIVGRDPEKTSYCSPWVLATIKHDDIVNPQGRVTDEFTDEMTEASVNYLSG